MSDPLDSYFLNKADRSPVSVVPHSARLQASDTMLQRAKFALVGQEHGIQELVRAYSAHSRLARFTSEDDRELPFVVVLAGPSGHGKTLLASKGTLSLSSGSSKPTLWIQLVVCWESRVILSI
jgi:ATP-dependent protease Clp ATPase subunit